MGVTREEELFSFHLRPNLAERIIAHHDLDFKIGYIAQYFILRYPRREWLEMEGFGQTGLQREREKFCFSSSFQVLGYLRDCFIGCSCSKPKASYFSKSFYFPHGASIGMDEKPLIS